jgi:phosphoglycerate kinase
MSDFSNKKTLNDVDLKDKKVIVRLDFNVPVKDGIIKDNKRIVASLKTLNYLLDNNCKIIVLAHFSRIKSLDDISSNKKTLAPVAKELQRLLPNNKVKFINTSVGQQVIDEANNLLHKEILLLENTRYNDVNEKNEVVKKESKCDQSLGKF